MPLAGSLARTLPLFSCALFSCALFSCALFSCALFSCPLLPTALLARLGALLLATGTAAVARLLALLFRVAFLATIRFLPGALTVLAAILAALLAAMLQDALHRFAVVGAVGGDGLATGISTLRLLAAPLLTSAAVSLLASARAGLGAPGLSARVTFAARLLAAALLAA